MTLRRATPDDAEALVRLRRVMFEAMGVDHSAPGWAEHCAEVLRAELASGRMAAYVVEAGGEVVAGGVGMVEQRLPGPRSPGGRYGYVQSMATEPEHRGNGYARAVFGALMDWFGEQEAGTVGLHATTLGEPLYRSFGLSESRHLELVWHRSP